MNFHKIGRLIYPAMVLVVLFTAGVASADTPTFTNPCANAGAERAAEAAGIGTVARTAFVSVIGTPIAGWLLTKNETTGLEWEPLEVRADMTEGEKCKVLEENTYRKLAQPKRKSAGLAGTIIGGAVFAALVVAVSR